MVDLGVTDYSNAVMIGDSSHDAIGAEKIGMDFIGVTYGLISGHQKMYTSSRQ